VVDNGSSHRGQASIDRLQDRWPKLRLVHLPVRAGEDRSYAVNPTTSPAPCDTGECDEIQYGGLPVNCCVFVIILCYKRFRTEESHR
jgi:hypothetical protein